MYALMGKKTLKCKNLILDIFSENNLCNFAFPVDVLCLEQVIFRSFYLNLNYYIRVIMYIRVFWYVMTME